MEKERSAQEGGQLSLRPALEHPDFRTTAQRTNI